MLKSKSATNTQPRVLILGSVSFALDAARVGINYIAEYLANNGYQVCYVSSASTLLDGLFASKWRRFRLAWLTGGRLAIAPNLTEVIFKSPWLLNRLRYAWQLASAGLFEAKLLGADYDLVITTVGALSIFSGQIKSKCHILRLQDHPHDFGISPLVVANFEHLLQRRHFKQVWAVSSRLVEYAARFYPSANYYLPNGVDLSQFSANFQQTASQRALYVGVLGAWFDLELICQTAQLLPHWQFDLYGRLAIKLASALPPNVHLCGEIAHAQLAKLFTNYAVGLIPFRDSAHLTVVERPLKFSQYLASGLGVASVDYGGLRAGMGEFACYGNGPQAFAKAIENAAVHRLSWRRQQIIDYLSAWSWPHLFKQMQELIAIADSANFRSE